jgi:hypothetical protein
MILIPLHAHASSAVRADYAITALGLIRKELLELSGKGALQPEHLQEMDAAEADFAMLRAGTRMRKSLSSLCGKFGGRAP